MLNVLRPPELSETDFYESARNRLTWNIHLFLLFALIPLMLIAISNGSIYAYYYGFGISAFLCSLFIMSRSGSFRIVSIVVSVLLFGLVTYSVFTIDSYIHYTEPFWALVVVLYVYFIHGRFWGGLTIILQIIACAFYFVFNLNANIGILNDIEMDRLLALALELTICLSMIGYILHQFIHLKNYAEQELTNVNDALRKEKELVESRNREKTILLQEIHHRVKNNLQIVMSLLRMQANKIASPETREHFNDAINRVLTMSLIHQKLYENENLSAVDFTEYVESLASDVLRSSRVQRDIDTAFSIEVPEIGMKTIVPIAIIITELISNSAKHAFETTEYSRIKLNAKTSSNSEILELIYSDNGVWKKTDDDTFGIQLIEALAEQLEGSYDLKIDEGRSTYTFKFKQLD
jgi:two-component sensor histidine kinase